MAKRKPITIEQDTHGFWTCSLFYYREQTQGEMDTEQAARAHAIKWVQKDIDKLQTALRQLREE